MEQNRETDTEQASAQNQEQQKSYGDQLAEIREAYEGKIAAERSRADKAENALSEANRVIASMLREPSTSKNLDADIKKLIK